MNKLNTIQDNFFFQLSIHPFSIHPPSPAALQPSYNNTRRIFSPPPYSTRTLSLSLVSSFVCFSCPSRLVPQITIFTHHAPQAAGTRPKIADDECIFALCSGVGDVKGKKKILRSPTTARQSTFWRR
jgi:hypothetical protein